MGHDDWLMYGGGTSGRTEFELVCPNDECPTITELDYEPGDEIDWKDREQWTAPGWFELGTGGVDREGVDDVCPTCGTEGVSEDGIKRKEQ